MYDECSVFKAILLANTVRGATILILDRILVSYSLLQQYMYRPELTDGKAS